MSNTTEYPNEQTGLLDCHEERQRLDQESALPASKIPPGPTVAIKGKALPYQVLPLALLAALAMAATAATTIFAYARLLCKVPTHCRDAERNLYAGAVAAATCMANTCGLLLLGVLERLSRQNYKNALLVWFSLRSMSVVMLAIGYQSRSILIALVSQVFEGLASDNLLHFNLNAIYVQTSKKEEVPRLIGTSLALYMVGISISPFAMGFLGDPLITFAIATSLFGLSILYLLVFVDPPASVSKSVAGGITLAPVSSYESDNDSVLWNHRRTPTMIVLSVLSPLQLFYASPAALAPSLSLLLYNTGQAFIFPAIMVRTSLRFGFSARENGLLISVAHATSALYLLVTLFVVPRLTQALKRPKTRNSDELPHAQCSRTSNAIFAGLSLTIQCLSLTALGLAKEAWQIYPIVCFFALGLASPSFIKSYTLVSFWTDDAQRAVATLTMMESTGSLLASILLGGLQTAWPGTGVLFVASGIIGLSTVVFGVSTLSKRTVGSLLPP